MSIVLVLCVGEEAENMLWFYVLVRGERIHKDMSRVLVLCVGEGAENTQGHEQSFGFMCGWGGREYAFVLCVDEGGENNIMQKTE